MLVKILIFMSSFHLQLTDRKASFISSIGNTWLLFIVKRLNTPGTLILPAPSPPEGTPVIPLELVFMILPPFPLLIQASYHFHGENKLITHHMTAVSCPLATIPLRWAKLFSPGHHLAARLILKTGHPLSARQP